MEKKLVKFEALVVSNGMRQSYFVDASNADEAREKVEELNNGREFKIVYLVSTPLRGTDPVERKKVEPTKTTKKVEVKEVKEEPVEAPAAAPAEVDEETTEVKEAPVVTEEEVPAAKPVAKKSKAKPVKA